jgi:hypothetical protein
MITRTLVVLGLASLASPAAAAPSSTPSPSLWRGNFVELSIAGPTVEFNVPGPGDGGVCGFDVRTSSFVAQDDDLATLAGRLAVRERTTTLAPTIVGHILHYDLLEAGHAMGFITTVEIASATQDLLDAAIGSAIPPAADGGPATAIITAVTCPLGFP